MKANEFIKKNGLWVFKHALAQLSFKKGMYLVVYHYECEFVDEIKSNHGDCVFTYEDVKRLVESWELVESLGGYELAKKELQRQSILRWINPETETLRQAIADVESCQ